jgi:hypothetical protein
MSLPSSSPPPPSAAGAEATSLAPGFRFHPTDEELVTYYLKRKVLGRPLKVDAIAEVDLYKIEPWDLPARSRLRSRDSQWYFFSRLDRKHANRARTNRATDGGYWKTTGKDREVRHGPRVVGMKKTLVFHAGRAPKGERTNWVMHEYRLEGQDIPQVVLVFPSIHLLEATLKQLLLHSSRTHLWCAGSSRRPVQAHRTGLSMELPSLRRSGTKTMMKTSVSFQQWTEMLSLNVSRLLVLWRKTIFK